MARLRNKKVDVKIMGQSKNISVDSPCVRNCCLDSDDVCIGCGRALEEITGWSAATDVERKTILKKARSRLIEREGRWPS